MSSFKKTERFVFVKKVFVLMIVLLSTHLSASVVGIHGFVASKMAMRKMGKCLERVGFDFIPWRYEARQETVECHAQRLKEMLKELACAHPGEPINFVCHSIGGLVLRAAVSLSDCPHEAKIGRAVLLATPNRGSMLARKVKEILPIRLALGTKSGKELMCYSPEQMEALGTFPCTMQVLVLAGNCGTHLGFDGMPNDGFVSLDETRLCTPHAFLVLPLTHGGLLTNEIAIRITRDFLLCGTLPQIE